jgi:hypothetical protein
VAGVLRVEIGAGGVLQARHPGELHPVPVRHVDGDAIDGVGLRVISAGDVPMTLTVEPGPVGGVTTATAESAEGSWAGVCRRLPRPPSG